jgi:S-formylglutathione hydrolase
MKILGEHRSFGGVQGFYEHESSECRGPMRLSVYRPPQAEKGPVPAVYYLAGLTCTEETFPAKAGAQRVAAELGLALVAPDTSPRAARFPGDDASWDFGIGAGFYVDATAEPWSAAYRMQSYVTRELIAVVEAAFPVVRDRRGIFGHSMGGHGAIVSALRNPGLYRSVSALAPIASPTRCPWGEKAFSGYLGDDRRAYDAYDATRLLEGRTLGTELLVDQGLADKFLERELKPELLEEACASAGQPLTLRRHAGYDHGYYFVASFVEDHLRHHGRALS